MSGLGLNKGRWQGRGGGRVVLEGKEPTCPQTSSLLGAGLLTHTYIHMYTLTCIFMYSPMYVCTPTVTQYSHSRNQKHSSRTSSDLCEHCQLGDLFPNFTMKSPLQNHHHSFCYNCLYTLINFNYTSYTYEYILYKIRNISDKTTVPFDPFYNPECPGTAQR